MASCSKNQCVVELRKNIDFFSRKIIFIPNNSVGKFTYN